MTDATARQDWPAFPLNEKEDDGSHHYSHSGMTQLEYFAAHAPVSFADAMNCYGSRPNLTDDLDRAAFLATWAFLRVEFAKAMVAELTGESA